jgi:hypothetical protein
MSQKCYNHHCGKVLTEDDAARPFAPNSTAMVFSHHLCNECWARFDGQKMRGRFKMIGVPHADLVKLGQQMDQQIPGGCPFVIGHPSEESRYTESLDEWVSWQAPVG